MKVSVSTFFKYLFASTVSDPAAETTSRLTTDRTYFLRTWLDADELEWYIPAGINLPDLQRSLTVIEQFEETPFDLQGNRASQLLIKKRRKRGRRRVTRTSSSEDEDTAPRQARKAREHQTYKSAQFIEDSDEEYGRDIDEFFTREAELRKRTALAAVDSALNTGTMHPTGTKKRRRAQPPPGISKRRGAKRRALQSTSTTRTAEPGTPGGGGDGDGGHGGNSAEEPTHRSSPSSSSPSDQDNDAAADDDDDDGTNDSDGLSFHADRDAASRRRFASLVTPNLRRPKARPRYRGAPDGEAHAPDATFRNSSGDKNDMTTGHDGWPAPQSPRMDDDGDYNRGRQVSNSTGLRKGRLIISDEE